MTSNTAPSPNFTGINFNTDFFPSVAGEFVEYPVAQGPTTIATLYSSVIDTLSSGSAFNFLNTLVANLNIAINGGAGQTIRIGATTGTSVHCANIDHQGNSINNSTNAPGGTLNLCNNMTTGTLNIGTNTARFGPINIGTGVGATGNVNIGNSSSSTLIGGSLEATGLILANGNVKTSILDCNDTLAGTTALSIGPSAVNGNIIIGAALGVGDVAIGGAQSAGGTISLGSSNTVTTLNGVVSAGIGFLAGKTAIEINNGTRTLPVTTSGINQDYYYISNSGSVSTLTLPPVLANQIVNIKHNGTAASLTVARSGSSTIFGAGASSGTTTITGITTSVRLICDGTNWYVF